MASVHFTPNLRRHVNCPSCTAAGGTVSEVLSAVFREHPAVRGYVLDDQGEVRPHIAVFVNGEQIKDRRRMTDAVRADDQIYVMQALSGG
jgi:sulfur carrier protein ThiS